MSDHYLFVINTSKGKQRRLTITNPKKDATPAVLSNAVSGILSSDIFIQTDYGYMTSIKSAELVTETRNVLF